MIEENKSPAADDLSIEEDTDSIESIPVDDTGQPTVPTTILTIGQIVAMGVGQYVISSFGKKFIQLQVMPGTKTALTKDKKVLAIQGINSEPTKG